MKNGVSWDVTPCGSCKNRRLGRKYRFHHQGGNNMEAICSSETSVLTIATQRQIPEDDILVCNMNGFMVLKIAFLVSLRCCQQRNCSVEADDEWWISNLKEAKQSISRHLPRGDCGRTASVSAEIRNEHLPAASQEHYEKNTSPQKCLSNCIVSVQVQGSVNCFITSLFHVVMWNLVSEIKGGTQTKGVWEQNAEENILTEEGWNGMLWRKPRNEELRDLYSSPSIIRIMKSRRMMWAGHIARMREKRTACRLLVGKPEGTPRRR
jgi:hypothetical protein